jgi:alpha-D-xyloside xylohydrolase
MRVPQCGADAELALRWLQAAVFASHVRIDLDADDAGWLAEPNALAIARKWLSFRYRLLPYLEHVARDAVATGVPLQRAMPLAFPGDALLRGYDTQFMLGEALLVAPIVQPGGAIEIALPPGAWFDLNSRQRIAGPRVVRYRAAVEQFPVFGREGRALPLGPLVQHCGEIPDAARPLSDLWLFGKPAAALDGLAQASVSRDDAGGAWRVRVAEGVKVERFGDATDVAVETLA